MIGFTYFSLGGILPRCRRRDHLRCKIAEHKLE